MSARPGRLRELANALQLNLPLFAGSAAQPPVVHSGHRLIRLNGEFVEYELRRSARRTIGLTIDQRGLAVTAPRWVAQSNIDEALKERADWVLRKLLEWREHAARRARQALRWEHGAALPFLGETLVLQLEAGRRAGARRDGSVLRIVLAGQSQGQAPDPDQVRERAHAWLKAQAREVFDARLAHHAGRLGSTPTRWSLSSARTRWGSCSADGSIRLNWRLVHFPPEIVDYVICHELAHLREMNHGPRFWEIVERLFPGHAQARQWLRQHAGDLSNGME